MSHAYRAQLLRDEFEATVGIRPAYPRSRTALQNLRETLDRYNAANKTINDAQQAEDFANEFARLGRIDDDFDLDISTGIRDLEGEAGRILRRAKAQHRREDAAHVFSTWRRESPDDLDDLVVDGNIRVVAGILIQDYTLTSPRAMELLQKIRGEFMLKIKFIRKPTPDIDIWVVEDAFTPLKQVRDGPTLIISRVTAPGALVGIDGHYYKKAYPVSAVVYGLYPIHKPNQNNLAPMREGDLNCVAQRVIEHFKGAQRGGGLTPARCVKIADWEATVHEPGASLQDVSGLEKILKRPITVRDVAGEDLYNSGNYRANRLAPTELILHNGHAWGANLHFPQAREVHIYEGDVWKAIEKATGGKPKAVWVLGGGDDKKLTVDQFVFEDGGTYRTRKAHEGLIQACQELVSEDPEALANRAFGENHAASIMAKERNGWKPTSASLEDDIQKACVEHGHGGLWASRNYDTRDVVCIDMKSCFPASFQGEGEASPYFQRFGHPSHRMTRVAINGSLPLDIGTGFAQVSTWEFVSDCHPVIPAWFGKHFDEKGWAPTQLLTYLVETGLLTSLKVTEAILSFKQQKEVWLPDSRDQACSVIGKFTQGSKADGRRLTRRLVTDEGELAYLVRDTRQNGTLVGAPMKCPLGHILTYYDGSQPQYTHLRASMLAYAHINLLEMLRRFTPDEAVRVATDSIYVKKKAMANLKGVQAYVAPKTCECGWEYCYSCLTGEAYQPPAALAQWRDKGEQIYTPAEHAAYTPKPEYWSADKNILDSTAPDHKDPLTRHARSYLNGGGGSGKTTRVIELFRERKPLVFTPTHRLAKEMRLRGVEAQTYHSFFRWHGQTKWTPDRMGHKYIPRVIIWDEVCTVPQPILETFLNWLDFRGVQVICCGDQGQPPPIDGEAPHEWLREHVDYYEEITDDHRAKCPELRALKKGIRLQPDKIQCQEMRKVLTACRSWDDFVQAWHPRDLILVSRKIIRDQAQVLLFRHHKVAHPNEPVPLLYRPKDTRRQNVMVTIPGPQPMSERQQKLVLNDVVPVSVQTAQEVLSGRWGDDWALGYAMTVHSTQGLTIEDPQKVWIVDDYIEWSNLVYLAVSRVCYLSQLARCRPPPVGTTADGPPPFDEAVASKNIGRKLAAYKRQDQAKGCSGDHLRMKDVEALKEAQENHCAACNIKLLWCYAPNDTRQFSVDRLDNCYGHTRDNVRLTCLECNRKRGASVLN